VNTELAMSCDAIDSLFDDLAKSNQLRLSVLGSATVLKEVPQSDDAEELTKLPGDSHTYTGNSGRTQRRK
jgi:hypothetical protein